MQSKICTLPNVKLNKQGYIINKSELTISEIESIENELTVEPEIDIRYKKVTDDTFNIYLETISGDKIVVPRYYGIEKFGLPTNIKFNIETIDRINIEFKGELRDYQKEIITQILETYCTDITNPRINLKSFGGTIISIPPGKGKTVLAIYLICILGIRTLVVVHKTFLLNQWFERFKQYTNAEIGIIQQNHIDISGKQIVIAMLQSISMKDYDKELFQAFPFIIYDECHHLGAKMFSKSLIKLQAPFYLGLSATPERKDHLDKVFKYFLGPIGYRGTFEPNTNVMVRLYKYTIANVNFKSLYSKFKKIYMAPTMITNLCKIDERNNLIIKLITDTLKIDPGRKILILTGRCNASKNEKGVDHLKILSDKLSKTELADNWGYYKGGMKKIQLEISSEKQIILGTSDMAQEGLDIPELDTLILATPLRGDITQTCGRILRGGASLYQPLIYDIVDTIKPFSESARSRYGYYKSNEYTCEFYQILNGYDLDNIIKLNNSFLIPTETSLKKYKSEKTNLNNPNTDIDDEFLDESDNKINQMNLSNHTNHANSIELIISKTSKSKTLKLKTSKSKTSKSNN